MKITQNKTPEETLHLLYDQYHKQPIQSNKIVCVNFHGRGYGCNPKYIVQELLNRRSDLDIVWLINGDINVETFPPHGVRMVPYHSEQAIQEMATAKILIDNTMKFTGFKKRPDQYFIETWHGAISLKKLGYDNPSNYGSKKYEKRMNANFPHMDVILSNSKFGDAMYRSAFHYAGPILSQGYPRNDIMFDVPSKLKASICNRYHIPKNKKLILHAPTYRDSKSTDTYEIDYQRVLDQLGNDYVMLVRLHPRMQSQAKKFKYTDRIINASDYSDTQELMAVSDIMITDYSNVMFEFAMTGRPVYLFATDVEEYRKERDYYFDIYDLPFPVSDTTEKLISDILTTDMSVYQTKLGKFWDDIGLNETGHAAKYAAALIEKMIDDEHCDVAQEVKRLNHSAPVANEPVNEQSESWLQKIKRYQFLFEELVKRDFKKKYKRTVLGMGWSLLSPLLMLLVMKLVFTEFFGRTTPHYTIYLFCGNLIFTYFSEATKGGMQALMGNAKIFSKVTVPKYLFLLSKNVQASISFLLTLVVFFVFVAFDGLPFTWKFFCLLYPICCLVLFNIGVGLVLSALFVFFRDIKYLYDVFLKLLMYMSAIFYTIDRYSYEVQCVFLINPVYLFIRYFRKIVIEATIPSVWFHLLMAADVMIVLGLGCWMYKKFNTKFLYYV